MHPSYCLSILNQQKVAINKPQYPQTCEELKTDPKSNLKKKKKLLFIERILKEVKTNLVKGSVQRMIQEYNKRRRLWVIIHVYLA